MRQGELEACLAAIREFVAYVKTHEPGTVRYVALRDTKDPLRFVPVFEFADAAAEERHSGSPGVRRFTAVLYPRLEAPVEFADYEVVATT